MEQSIPDNWKSGPIPRNYCGSKGFSEVSGIFYSVLLENSVMWSGVGLVYRLHNPDYRTKKSLGVKAF